MQKDVHSPALKISLVLNEKLTRKQPAFLVAEVPYGSAKWLWPGFGLLNKWYEMIFRKKSFSFAFWG